MLYNGLIIIYHFLSFTLSICSRPLATNLVILNLGQVTRRTSKLLFIYLSNAHACLLDHLTWSLPVPTDDVISRVHRVQCIGAGGRHPFLHGCRVGMPRQQARPSQWRYIPKKSFNLVRRKSGQQPRLSPGALGLDPQVPEYPMAFQGSWLFGSR
ncbi:hypothetical protein TNCV_3787631 [Trichonephila clavipes]|nr:hypothetical protein TNCV_3787631 [Trichonephila clavipes]